MTQTIEQPEATSAERQYRTAADWWEALGCVPLGRIVFPRHPGPATEEDVLYLDDHEDRICELIDGTLVEKAMGYEESFIAVRLITLLWTFVGSRKLGIVTGEAGMMRILSNRVRIPDIAFVSRERLPDGQFPKKPIPSLVPDLAVEILSDSNTRKEMTIKLGEYFTAGVRLVWYVDPKTRSVDVYTAPDQLQRLTGDAKLTGGDVLPGFETTVAELFNLV